MKSLTKTLIFSLLLIVITASASTSGSTKENFDFGWKFFAGEGIGAEVPNFDDSSWRNIDLPHDWSIEGNFSKDNPAFSRGAWLPTGKVTYRKTFVVPANMKSKRYVIYFDGAYRNSQVFINGHLLGFRPSGFIAFHYDMTKYINYDGKNEITVKLDNSSQPGARWYTGTGIYRHVNLITTENVYVPVWGNRIISNDYTPAKANISIETLVKNEFKNDKKLTIRHTAYTPQGKIAAKVSKDIAVPAASELNAKVILEVPKPQLWNQEKPNLYTIETELLVDGKVIYSETNKTGIRKLEFSSTEGFKLNGKVVKLKGVCLHHAGGPLGAAIYRRTTERQLEKLREMGCNAVRTAHNPFSEEFLNVCDSMGFFVMNEMFDEWEKPKSPMTVQNGKKTPMLVDYYAKYFKEWSDRDLTDNVLRDRNHPSVIMWSIGNEIDQMKDPEGTPIASRLAAIVHANDYRPVTNGVHGYAWGRWPNEDAAATSDIKGYNYMKAAGFDKERKLFPNAMAIVTECESAQTFYPRATYLYDDAKKAWWDKLGYEFKDAYDWVEKRDLCGTSGMEAWKAVKERPYVMGQFIWTGWDYLGEVIPFGWPARSSSFAPIDLAGFPKDGYYFYQSQWSEKPMVHIFPHWNLQGMEGKIVTVYGFTNGDEVELFQDGKSLGKKKNDINGVENQSWDVVYHPGELKAVATKNGKVIAQQIVRTAGIPSNIRIESRRKTMKANAQDLIYVECTINDKDGNEVPTANNKLEFKVEGVAKIAGVVNGDNMGLEPFKSNVHSAFNGKCLVILQSTKKAGDIKLTVQSNGLANSIVKFSSK